MTVTERILARSAEMFMRSGIKAITMDDISRETGVSKRTIYENFKDKDDLLLSCLTYVDETKKKETEQIINESENTIDMVFSLLRDGVNTLKVMNPLFFTDLKRYHYGVWKKTYLKNAEQHLLQTISILRKGISEGLLRKEIDIEITAILLHEQLKIMSDESIFPANKYSIVIVFENIIINFIRGIATKKGLELTEKYQEDKV
jgi:TetR/AcrR family transcriptional regulator, cholesterol catabolism regulator